MKVEVNGRKLVGKITHAAEQECLVPSYIISLRGSSAATLA